MCGWDAETSPWNLLHFVGVGITSFSFSNRLIVGGEVLLMEAILILVFVVPFLFVQLKLGGLLQRSVYGLFDTSFPFFRGVAVMILAQLLLLAVYFPGLPVFGIYTGFAVATADPATVSSCANAWNTPQCFDENARDAQLTSNATYVVDHGDYAITPEAEFIERKVLAWITFSRSLDKLGGFNAVFPVALVVTWIFIFLMVGFGPRVFGWAASILGLVYVVLWISVLGYGWHQLGDRASWSLLLHYYLPNFSRMAEVYHWTPPLQTVGFLSMLFSGILPTMGKFTGNGKTTRNVTWIFAILVMTMLRHLPTLAIAPYQYAAAVAVGVDVNAVSRSSLNMQDSAMTMVLSKSPPAVTFLVFFAQYIHHVCAIALIVVVIVDNCMDVFDWLLKKRQSNRRVVWLITSAVFCTVLLLCGIPFTTRGGVNLLIFFDVSVYNLVFVSRYFLALGLLGVYLWQDVASAERLVFGIWGFLVAVIWVMAGVISYVRYGDKIFSLRRDDLLATSSKKWRDISLVIAGVPFTFILILMIVHFIQFLIQCRRSGESEIEQPPPYGDAINLSENREEHTDKNPEHMELLSSC